MFSHGDDHRDADVGDPGVSRRAGLASVPQPEGTGHRDHGEAGELLQHFVWQTPDQSERRIVDRRPEIESEIADLAILLFELADNCGTNLAAAIRTKLARNELRYPADKARGSDAKDDEL